MSNMRTLEVGPWVLEYDRDATKTAYAQIDKCGPEECGCTHCQNFMKLREKIYPKKVLEIFDLLGIDYTKENEVYHTHKTKPGWHSYGGWLHFIGSIIKIIENRIPLDSQGNETYLIVEKHFEWSFRERRDEASSYFDENPLVQIDFSAEVPWVLEDEEPE